MKNFTIGFLGVITTVLLSQNIALRQSALQALQPPQKTVQKVVAVRKAKPKIEVVVVPQEPTTTEVTTAYSDRDPRCPSHLPYWGGRWGCVVQRVQQ